MNERTGETIFTDVARARRPGQRVKGLLGTTHLPEGAALLIEGARQVHTFGMRYPLDLIFCDKSLKVVAVLRQVRPMRLTLVRWRARYVLEAAGGTVTGVEMGDVLALQPIER